MGSLWSGGSHPCFSVGSLAWLWEFECSFFYFPAVTLGKSFHSQSPFLGLSTGGLHWGMQRGFHSRWFQSLLLTEAIWEYTGRNPTSPSVLPQRLAVRILVGEPHSGWASRDQGFSLSHLPSEMLDEQWHWPSFPVSWVLGCVVTNLNTPDVIPESGHLRLTGGKKWADLVVGWVAAALDLVFLLYGREVWARSRACSSFLPHCGFLQSFPHPHPPTVFSFLLIITECMLAA